MAAYKLKLKPTHLSKPELSPLFLPSLFSSATSLAKLHIGGIQAGGISWCEEVTEAVLGEVPVFVVVEGLSWKLAEEVGTVPEAAGADVLIQRSTGSRQRLCAAAAANAARNRTNKDSLQQYCSSKSLMVCGGMWQMIWNTNLHWNIQ